MDINEQTGYTGNNPNSILKFKDWNPLNRGTMGASDKVGQIRAKDIHGINKFLQPDPEDDEKFEEEEENDVLDINSEPEDYPHYTSYPFGFVGAPMAIGDSMSESLGVPNEINPWVNLIYQLIINQIHNFVKTVEGTDEYNVKFQYEEHDWVVKSVLFNIKGEDFNKYVKEHIPKDNKLKIRNLNIHLDISTFSTDLFTFDPWSAAYSEDGSEMRKNILYNPTFKFELFIPAIITTKTEADEIDELISQFGIDKKIIEFTSHEVTHMYEYYNRRLNKVSEWRDRYLNSNKYLVEKELLSNVSDDWKYFLRLIYLSLDFEINARVSQLYYSISGMDPGTKYDFMELVREDGTWKEMMSLKEFDAEKFVEDFTYKASDKDLKKAFLELDLYTEEELENSSMKELLLKELVSLWDKNIDENNTLYASGEMRRLSPFYINNPMIFFRKFEKRFKWKANKWERKIYKLSAKFDLD